MWCVVFLFETPLGDGEVSTMATKVFKRKADALASAPENCVVVELRPGVDIDQEARKVALARGVKPWKGGSNGIS